MSRILKFFGANMYNNETRCCHITHDKIVAYQISTTLCSLQLTVTAISLNIPVVSTFYAKLRPAVIGSTLESTKTIMIEITVTHSDSTRSFKRTTIIVCLTVPVIAFRGCHLMWVKKWLWSLIRWC